MPKPKYPVSPWDLETINLDWSPIGLKEAPDVENVPSKDYAIFLAYTVKYHLGSLYDIIDHDTFHQHLHEFYSSPASVATEHRYWFAQFLFVLAFGEAFSKTESNEAVPGLSYASRALSLIPNLVPIDKSSLPAVEALCLAALYLQAVDLRLMAFQLVRRSPPSPLRSLPSRSDKRSAYLSLRDGTGTCRRRRLARGTRDGAIRYSGRRTSSIESLARSSAHRARSETRM